MMDGVPSKVNVLLWKVSYPELMFFLWKVSKSCVDSLIVLFMDCVQSWVSVLFMESVQSWSRHQKLQEDWIGYTGYQHKFMSIKSMSLLKPGATRCHGTRIARGVPLPVYNNLDLNSGFWCTSRCVVF